MTRTDTALLTPAEVRWVVAQAVRAPSIHNTQPWLFEWSGEGFVLRGDTRRGLSAIDPDGRELVVSCGAALFNLRVALRKLGCVGEVSLLPDPHDPRLLACVTVHPGAPADAAERRTYAALIRRHTHRGRFDDRVVPAHLAVMLQQAARLEGVTLFYVSDPGQRQRVLHLARAAERTLAADPDAQAELEQWTPAPTSRRRDGVPATAYVAEPVIGPDDLPQRDFDRGRRFGRRDAADAPPGAVAVVVTDRDVELDWLQAGQALERVLVTAAEHWAFASLHSQVVEVPHLRDELRRELCTPGFPQILLRVGFAAEAPLTPRRDVDDVLDVR